MTRASGILSGSPCGCCDKTDVVLGVIGAVQTVDRSAFYPADKWV